MEVHDSVFLPDGWTRVVYNRGWNNEAGQDVVLFGLEEEEREMEVMCSVSGKKAGRDIIIINTGRYARRWGELLSRNVASTFRISPNSSLLCSHSRPTH